MTRTIHSTRYFETGSPVIKLTTIHMKRGLNALKDIQLNNVKPNM